MAQALFTAYAQKRPEGDAWVARSAGTWAVENQPATDHAIAVMAQRGLALSQHRAHQVVPEDVDLSEVIIVMTRNHREALISEFPMHKQKIHLMSELEEREYDIADPYGRTLDEYAARARELAELIERGFERINQWAQNIR